MVQFISFHSLKGGTGKTTLATNFAVLSALNGKNVCLLDFDFRAPSQHVFFLARPRFWLNDFLDGKCKVGETLHKMNLGDSSELHVGFANPSTEAMRSMMTKNREWEANALSNILASKSVMKKEGRDFVILDTSPGIQYSSINALAASNLVILVLNRDELHREDVVNLVKKVYKPLDRKIGIVLNKVLFCTPGEKVESTKLAQEAAQLKNSVENRFNCPILGIIPCFCDILIGGYKVYALHRQSHPFMTEVSTLAENIQNMLQ